MVTPENGGTFDPRIYSRRAINLSEDGQRRVTLKKFGSIKARKSESRRQNYLGVFQRNQFNRAFSHLIEGNETNEEVFYVFGHADEFLKPLTPEDFDGCITRLTENDYNNADVVMVANHFIFEGNAEGYREVRKFLIDREV